MERCRFASSLRTSWRPESSGLQRFMRCRPLVPNRLVRETSPYLRQHAENPVDWFPWGPEALSLARSRDIPILLSIGYSSCHWCHVMERESFMNPAIAQIMNEGFVNVKVDREERPDIDGIYLRAVQMMTGQGGWPLTVFLTPDGVPVYGGTYFPPAPRHGRPGFPQLLEAIRTAWSERRTELLASTEQLREILERSTLPQSNAEITGDDDFESLLNRATARILRGFDPEHGGFGQAPKFPQPVVLDLLLRRYVQNGNAEVLDAVVTSLGKMARGGIRDHLGGGFHRYSVDREWLVPHFEKMLYDNALLAGCYLRGFQASGDVFLRRTCVEILDDLLTDFLSPEGAFYTAWDADSEEEEGLYYLWTLDEVEELLTDEEARLFARAYDVSEAGNFEGKNILHLPEDLEALARQEGISLADLEERLARSRRVLGEARRKRIPPLRDEKILAGWNGLAIRALAEAGAALDEPRFLAAARRAADWLLDALRPEGRLLHQIAGGEAKTFAFLEDVAGFGNALLSLHEATLEGRWLDEAVRLDEEVELRFRDPRSGLLYDAPDDGETLLIRPREVTDSPSPSGVSLAAELRLRLGRILGDPKRVEEAREIVIAEGGAAAGMPAAFARLLVVAEELASPSIEIVILGGEDEATRSFLREAHRTALPGKVITGSLELGETRRDHLLLEGKRRLEGSTTVYLCQNSVCLAPTTELSQLAVEIAAIGRR